MRIKRPGLHGRQSVTEGERRATERGELSPAEILIIAGGAMEAAATTLLELCNLRPVGGIPTALPLSPPPLSLYLTSAGHSASGSVQDLGDFYIILLWQNVRWNLLLEQEAKKQILLT